MKSKILAIVAAAMLAGPMSAWALIVGNGNSNNCIPFGCDIYGLNYQQVYSASLFNGIISINSFTFYAWANDTDLPQPDTFSLFLSTTLDDVGALSGIPGADETLVYSGSIPALAPVDGGQIEFLLSSTFSYDPSAGNLLLRVLRSGGDPDAPWLSFISDDGASAGGSGLISRWYGGNGGLTGLVTGFNEVSVPEPGTLALLSLGLAGLATARRRKQ